MNYLRAPCGRLQLGEEAAAANTPHWITSNVTKAAAEGSVAGGSAGAARWSPRWRFDTTFPDETTVHDPALITASMTHGAACHDMPSMMLLII